MLNEMCVYLNSLDDSQLAKVVRPIEPDELDKAWSVYLNSKKCDCEFHRCVARVTASAILSAGFSLPSLES